MSKLSNYTGTIKLISGLTQANGQDFPILEAHAIVVDDNDTRLDTIVEAVQNKQDRWATVKFGSQLVSDEDTILIYNNGRTATVQLYNGGTARLLGATEAQIHTVKTYLNVINDGTIELSYDSSEKVLIKGVKTSDGSNVYEAANVDYVNNKITEAMSTMTSGLKRIIVDELPSDNVDESAIYMLGTATDSLIGSEANLTQYAGSAIDSAVYYPNGDTFIYGDDNNVVECYSFIESHTVDEIKIEKPDILLDSSVVINYVIVSSINTEESPVTVSLDFYGYRKIDNIYLEYMYINSRWETIGNTSTEGGNGTTAIITNMQNTINQLNDRLTALESKAATVYSV